MHTRHRLYGFLLTLVVAGLLALAGAGSLRAESAAAPPAAVPLAAVVSSVGLSPVVALPAPPTALPIAHPPTDAAGS